MEITKIFIGSDHAGFELKNHLVLFLEKQGFEVEDVGTHSEERCDASDYAERVACSVTHTEGAMGVLICGTGMAMSITANKIKHCWAARCCSEEDALLARQHNGANVLCLGARQISKELAEKIALVFMLTEELGDRYEERREKLYEREELYPNCENL